MRENKIAKIAGGILSSKGAMRREKTLNVTTENELAKILEERPINKR